MPVPLNKQCAGHSDAHLWHVVCCHLYTCAVLLSEGLGVAVDASNTLLLGTSTCSARCCKVRDANLALRAAAAGQRVIRAYMPEQHRLFFSALPWLLVGVQDKAGRSMALALTGAPGFIHTPTATTVTIAPHQPLDPGDSPASATDLCARVCRASVVCAFHTAEPSRLGLSWLC